jgi:hypothetical protein
MSAYRDSGFTALGPDLPQQAEPANWLCWHFTHLDNVPLIVEAGALLAPAHIEPATNVALLSIKDRRQSNVMQPDEGYPKGKFVSDHVPFYIAAKSPMLYTVTEGHEDYDGGDGPLIFLGTSITKLIESGVTWCVSNGNAASSYVQFTRDLHTIGSFVDFDLLCAKWWSRTTNDPYRPGRRAAEVLVLDRLHLELITHVVTKSSESLELARSHQDDGQTQRQYRI